MPLHLETKRLFTNRTERVKAVDIHPSEPWVLSALFSGVVQICNFQTQQIVKSMAVCDLPIRAARFVARKEWFLTGSDDQMLRVYNYNTMEKIKAWDAHVDYIRSIAVHPSRPLIVSSADDLTVKVWDWERGFSCVQVCEGHGHFVMQVAINPKDPNTFASASLDRTVKVWSFGASTPNFTLEGHERGVNCVEYFPGGDKPLLASGSDDHSVRIWDYTTKQCVQVLSGHLHNVSSVGFHPDLPIILSGSEDGTIKIWHIGTYRLESTLNSAMERCWTIGVQKGSNKIAAGFDGGTVVLKFGSEEPVASMDSHGKTVWVRNSEMRSANVKALQGDAEDGETLVLPVKELGSSELFPQSVKHNRNGRFVCVIGDGEYVIYTALAWRSKAFGSGMELAWSGEPTEYAVKENSYSIRVFDNFKEKYAVRPKFGVEKIFGGHLFSAVSSSFLSIHSWEDLSPIRRIDVVPKLVLWSESGDLVAVVCGETFYVLKYNRNVVVAHVESGAPTPEEGIENAFDMLFEVAENVVSAVFVGNTFVYVNNKWRVNYCIAGQTTVVAHVDRPVYILGYVLTESRLFLMDRSHNIVSYGLSHALMEYEGAIARRDMEAAKRLLPLIPEEKKNEIAHFLEAQGYLELALDVATDVEQKFDLAVSLSRLDLVEHLATQLDSKGKWKQLADLALAAKKMELSERAMFRAQDFSGLLLLFTSTGNAEGLAQLAESSEKAGVSNVAFQCNFLLHRLDQCYELMVKTGRGPEAALFKRAYLDGRTEKEPETSDTSVEAPVEDEAAPAEDEAAAVTDQLATLAMDSKDSGDDVPSPAT